MLREPLWAFLAACPAPQAGGGAESGGGEAAAEPITLEFLSWGGNDPTAYEELAGSYADINADVTVNIASAPGDEYYPKFSTMVAGGETPNIASFQGWEWQPFFDKGVLADLGDFVATNDYFGSVYDDSIKSISDSTLRNGSRVLIPMQWGYHAYVLQQARL